MSAGCSMADMANLAKVERAWREIGEVIEPDEEITPITYINSAADLKAFCGEHGGIVCTSTNARQILQWAFARRNKVLFFPDQHLGRWTGYLMDIPLSEMLVWDPDLPMGGLTAPLFGASDVSGFAYPALAPAEPGRHGDQPPRVQLRGLQTVGLCRLHRLHS
jgi:quinolinate synthase